MEKAKPNTTKAPIHRSKEMYYNMKETQRTKAISRLLRYSALNGAGLFSKKNIKIREVSKVTKRSRPKEKSEESRISGEAYDINKQTI